MNKNTLDISFFQNTFKFKCSYCIFLAVLLRALLVCETVCLARLSSYLGYKNCASAYQRIRRFLENIHFAQEQLADAFVRITSLNAYPKWVLILDRTYWQFGKTHLNFLYLSVSAGPFCIPLFFNLLGPDKKGNSSFEERKTILDLFFKCFDKTRIQYILGDREFIGEQWLNYLKEHDIPFAQRLREKGQKIANTKGEMLKAHELFHDIKVGEERDLGLRKIGSKKGTSLELHIIGTRSIKGDLVVLAYHHVDDPLLVYRNRWNIEICFRTLKSHGFHMEDSHVTKPHRITCLLNIVSLAYAVSVKIGAKLNDLKPIPIKNHGYPAKGFVRYALDFIKPYLLTTFSPSRTTTNRLFLPPHFPLIPYNATSLTENVG